jgi:hypothetical protein
VTRADADAPSHASRDADAGAEESLPERLTAGGVLAAGLRGGGDALRAKAVPGLVLWAVATAIVLGYFLAPPVTQAMDALGAVKDRYGYAFSVVSTAVFGGLIPWAVTRARLGGRGQGRVAFGALLVAFWGYKGFEVDAFYRLQAVMWGEGRDAWTIACKTAVDQLVYVPLWAVPSSVAAYRLERFDGRLGAWWQSLDRRWVAGEVLPITVANVAVWVPAVVAVYLLPLPLQLPMQNLVLCLWALMLVFMTDPKGASASDATAGGA